jgi:hypothetical protein
MLANWRARLHDFAKEANNAPSLNGHSMASSFERAPNSVKFEQKQTNGWETGSKEGEGGGGRVESVTLKGTKFTWHPTGWTQKWIVLAGRNQIKVSNHLVTFTSSRIIPAS